MKIEQVPIEKLFADPANLRRHDARNIAAIQASLTKYGQVKPIVADAKGIVLAGNGTLEAARELGWTKVAVVRSNLSGVEATGYSIADNRTTDLSLFDGDALGETLRALESEGFDLSAVGFTEEEFAALSGDAPDFMPATLDDQGHLDERGKLECPNCGHEFSP